MDSMWKYFDERAKRLGILDTKLAQGAAMCLILIIVKLVPRILDANIWLFVILAIALSIKPLMTFYGPESGRAQSG